jgi:hypothetical protein
VIDIVPIASEFDHSVLINPAREEHMSSFGLQGKYIDEYFEHFLQMGAGDAVEEMTSIIEEFMDV